MDNTTLALVCMVVAFFLAVSAFAGSEINNKRLRKRWREAVQAGAALQQEIIANDKAWREGQDDLEAALSAEILDRDDEIERLNEKLEASRGNLGRLLSKIADLQTAHAMHTDHCLPVLSEMREVAFPVAVEIVKDVTPAEKYLSEHVTTEDIERWDRNGDAADA